MKCQKVQLWLLTADDTAPAPSAVRRHLYECAECRRQRERLLKLNTEVRQLPLFSDNPAVRTQLWERIGLPVAPVMPSPLPPPLPPPLPFAVRHPLPFRRLLRWTAAAALLLAMGWFLARQFMPQHGDSPASTPLMVVDGHPLSLGHEERVTLLRVARHDVRLAETPDAAEQLDVLLTLAGDLKDEALRMARAGKRGNLPLLTSLYEQVVQQGIVQRAAALPMDKRLELVTSLAGRLRATAIEVEAATREAKPEIAEILQSLRAAARESADRLEDRRQPASVVPALVFGSGPTPLLTVLVLQGIRLAQETDMLRRADLSAELVSYLAPAIVLLSTNDAATEAQELSSCMEDLLELGVADNLDRAIKEKGSTASATEVEKVRQRSAQAVSILEQHLAKVPASARAGLQRALDAARSGNDRVKEAGAGKDENRPVGPPKNPVEDRPGKGDKGKGPRDIKGVVKAVDEVKNTITVTRKHRGETADQTYALLKDVPVVIGGKPAKLGNLKAGMEVYLKLTDDRKTVERIHEGKDGDGDHDKEKEKEKGKDKDKKGGDND